MRSVAFEICGKWAVASALSYYPHPEKREG